MTQEEKAQQTQPQSQSPAQPKPKKKRWYLGCLGIVIGLILLIIIIAAISSGGKKDEGKQAMPENSPKPPMEIEMNVLVAAFDQNQLEAEQRLNGQFITTEGFITNISEDILGNPFASLKPTSDPYYFGTTLQCFPKDRNKNELMGFKNGEKIGVRGIVNGQSLGIIGLKDCEAFKLNP